MPHLAGDGTSAGFRRRGPAAVAGRSVRNGALRRGLFGSGVEKSSFTVPDSGDTVGSYAQYFSGARFAGSSTRHRRKNPATFRLPGFTELTGTVGPRAPPVTVTETGGTGTLAKASGTKGVLKCTSGDSVHLTCTEKLKLKQL